MVCTRGTVYVPVLDAFKKELNRIYNTNPSDIASQIIRILQDGVAPDYPIHHHHPESVVAKYLDLLKRD